MDKFDRCKITVGERELTLGDNIKPLYWAKSETVGESDTRVIPELNNIKLPTLTINELITQLEHMRSNIGGKTLVCFLGEDGAYGATGVDIVPYNGHEYAVIR